MEVVIFGLKLNVDPIAFTIKLGDFEWSIYWYGVIIALGFLGALVYAMKYYKRFNLDLNRILDVVLVTTPLAILCARAYYVIFDGEKLESFGEFFGFGSDSGISGLAIYGGVIGAFLIGAGMCIIRKVNILDMFDITAIGFLIGQGVGRWGNFINQEAFGGPTGSSWWGMTSENVVYDFTVNGYDPNALAHPCFLYESLWCIAGFFLLHHFSKKRLFSGQMVLMYGVWYGFGRGFIELLRTDSLMLGKIKVSSLLSFALCLGAGALLYAFTKKAKNSDEGKVYDEMFNADDETETIEEKSVETDAESEEETEENE